MCYGSVYSTPVHMLRGIGLAGQCSVANAATLHYHTTRPPSHCMTCISTLFMCSSASEKSPKASTSQEAADDSKKTPDSEEEQCAAQSPQDEGEASSEETATAEPALTFGELWRLILPDLLFLVGAVVVSSTSKYTPMDTYRQFIVMRITSGNKNIPTPEKKHPFPVVSPVVAQRHGQRSRVKKVFNFFSITRCDEDFHCACDA